MSKEIYKEYVNKWIDADNWDKREKINDQFLCGILTLVDVLEARGADGCDLFSIQNLNYSGFTRVPKKHNINGYEVIAPRYDEPKSKSTIFYLDFDENNGVCEDSYNAMMHQNTLVFGWFDNEQDAVLYANAHKESK